jgi:hypothetical protein
MNFTRLFLAASAIGALCTSAALADTLTAGTTLSGTLTSPITTGKANLGDTFTLNVTSPYPNDDQSYAGATVQGHVAQVIRAGQGRKAELDLAFDSITLANGQTAPVVGHVVRVDEKKDDSTGRKVLGAGIGMIVGNILGKAIGTNLGGLVGAAGGFLYASNTGDNLTVPQDATVVLQLDDSVTPQTVRQST